MKAKTALRRRSHAKNYDGSLLSPALPGTTDNKLGCTWSTKNANIISVARQSVFGHDEFKSLSQNSTGGVQRPGKSEQSNGYGTCNKLGMLRFNTKKQATSRIASAVVLGVAVLLDDGLDCQRDNFLALGVHQHSGNCTGSAEPWALASCWKVVEMTKGNIF